LPFDLVIIEAAELQNFSDEITISNIEEIKEGIKGESISCNVVFKVVITNRFLPKRSLITILQFNFP